MKLATKMVPGSVYQPGPELRLPMPEPQPQPQPQEVAVLPLELRRVAMSKLPSTPQAPVAARAGMRAVLLLLVVADPCSRRSRPLLFCFSSSRSIILSQ